MKQPRNVYSVHDLGSFETWTFATGSAPTIAEGGLDPEPRTRAEMAAALSQARREGLDISRIAPLPLEV